jgi:uncharacterized RDD family membrane protein YckC
MTLITFAAIFLLLLLTALPATDWLLDLVEDAAAELSPNENRRPALGREGLLLIALITLVQLAIELFYFVFFETVWRGRSPGKRLLGLGVAHDDGLPVSFGASLVRNLLRAVDILPGAYTTGLVAMLVSKQTQRLGDVAAGTVVIRFDRPRAAAPLADGEDDDAPHFPFTREQLERVGPVERRLLRQTLRRIQGLPVAEAQALATRSARALADRIGTGELEPGTAGAWLRALHTRLRRRSGG